MSTLTRRKRIDVARWVSLTAMGIEDFTDARNRMIDHAKTATTENQKLSSSMKLDGASREAVIPRTHRLIGYIIRTMNGFLFDTFKNGATSQRRWRVLRQAHRLVMQLRRPKGQMEIAVSKSDPCRRLGAIVAGFDRTEAFWQMTKDALGTGVNGPAGMLIRTRITAALRVNCGIIRFTSNSASSLLYRPPRFSLLTQTGPWQQHGLKWSMVAAAARQQHFIQNLLRS